MGAYIVRRLVQTFFVIWIVTVVVFMFIQMIPGDPAITMLGFDARPEQIDALRAELWLDRPVMVQYGHWLGNILHGDLGRSLKYRQDVAEIIAERMPVSLYLCGMALIIAAVMGIAGGMICAIRRASILDQVITALANLGISVPQFWLGLLLIYGIALKLGWLPIQGWTSPFEDFWLSLRQSIMPVICLALMPLAEMVRQTRSAMLEVIHQDYIRTAWANGLKERTIVIRHALKNALIPVVTIIGLYAPMLFGGTVLVEMIFNIPGIGTVLVRSVFAQDFVVVQGCVLVIAVGVSLANLLVDLSYAYLNPRMRYE